MALRVSRLVEAQLDRLCWVRLSATTFRLPGQRRPFTTVGHRGHVVSYLRFSPVEYRALRQACGPVSPLHFRPRALQRVLIASLQDTHPALATRISQLRIRQLSILCEHFRPRQPKVRHDLTLDEVGTLAEAFGPLLRNVRFSHLLQRPLVRQLLLGDPCLAAKLHHLSQEQFREVCEQVRACLGRGP